jgi:ribonucleotide reductase, class II
MSPIGSRARNTIAKLEKMNVVKRDGRQEPFLFSKVVQAIKKALVNGGGFPNDDATFNTASDLSARVCAVIAKTDNESIKVEEVQKLVIQQLWAQNFDNIATHYTIYKEERKKSREVEPVDENVRQMIEDDYKHFQEPSQYFQLMTKFARWQDSVKRRETWGEACERVVGWFKKQSKFKPVDVDTWDRLKSSLYDLKASPAMRVVQMAGPPLDRCNVGVFNCLGEETEFVTDEGVRSFKDFCDGDEITVLGHSGQWRKAVVRMYGRQKLNTYTFARGRTTLKVRATENHKWLLNSPYSNTYAGKAYAKAVAGSGGQPSLLEPEDSHSGFWETTSLMVGDKLAKAPMPFEQWSYDSAEPFEKLYWAYGYVYGDGTKVAKDGEYKHSMVRLCKAESERYAARFEELGFKTSKPLSCGGDVFAYTGQYLKTLPDMSKDGVALVRAFVRGFLDADGAKTNCVSSKSSFRSIQVTGKESVDFVRNVFPAVGVYVTREEDLTHQVTNFGPRSAETIRFSLITDMGVSPSSYFSCSSVEEGQEENVWCLEVEEDQSFVLSNGLLTGNCSYLPITDLFSFVELLYILMQGTGAGFSVEGRYIEELPRIKRQKKEDKILHTVEDSTEGWCDALKLGLESWFEGRDVKFDFSKVRPANSILKTKGGRGCGPDPLKDLLNFARNLILSRQGRFLTELDCHDLACMVGKIVQVGGVRRAALISLSDLDSHEMRNAKAGSWWQNSVHRSMANNSAVYNNKPSVTSFMEEWLSLAKSGSGERGIFNREGVIKALPKRRKKANFGTNPCFHPETRIHTEYGLVRAIDLFNTAKPLSVTVDGRTKPGDMLREISLRPASMMVKTQSNVMTYKLTTEHGHNIVVTANHEFPTQRGRLKLQDIKPGDTLMLQADEGFFGKCGNFSEGITLGVAAGGGKVDSDRNNSTVSLEGFAENLANRTLVKTCKELIAKRTSSGSTKVKDYDAKLVRLSGSVFSNKIRALCGYEDLNKLKTVVPEAVMQGSRGMVAGYLVGLLTSAGKIQKNKTHSKKTSLSLTMDSDCEEFISSIQLLLSNFGIVSKARKGKSSSDVIAMLGKKIDYAYSLVVDHANCITMMETLGLDGYIGRVMGDLVDDMRLTNSVKPEEYLTAVKSITEYEVTDVYCLNQPTDNNVIAQGMITGQCAEIILRPYEFCNLSIAIARPDDTRETLAEKVKVAAIFGTLQSACTDFKYIRKEWKNNCEEEALLGVDITGQMDCPLLRPGAPGREELLEYLKGLAIEVNREWAFKLGIKPSVSVTCVKPSGDSAQFFNCGSGIHAWFAQFFIRRMRERRDSPIAKMLMDQGVPWIVAPEDPALVCFEFPRKAPEGAPTKHDQTVIDQLENWLVWKKHWAEHSVSATIYVDESEWLKAGNWVYEHFDEVSGLSFLPRDNGTYTGTPYEEITEEEYIKRKNAMPDIDWSKLTRYESEDNTVSSQTLACTAAGGCESA